MRVKVAFLAKSNGFIFRIFGIGTAPYIASSRGHHNTQMMASLLKHHQLFGAQEIHAPLAWSFAPKQMRVIRRRATGTAARG